MNMITEAIATVVNGENLDKEMAAAVMDEIMSGEATQAQIGSFLTALHIKGETIEEITAFAEIMRKHCGEFTPDVDEEIDIVGTGGDCAGTFNISTVSSLVTAVVRWQSMATVQHPANAEQPTAWKPLASTSQQTVKSAKPV